MANRVGTFLRMSLGNRNAVLLFKEKKLSAVAKEIKLTALRRAKIFSADGRPSADEVAVLSAAFGCDVSMALDLWKLDRWDDISLEVYDANRAYNSSYSP